MLYNTILSAAISRALRGPAYQDWGSVFASLRGGLS